MTNLYPFIQGWLEWTFRELFSANISLWNRYKYIAFNIFSCRILIISYKILIIARISNEKTNELTIYEILCWNVTMLCPQELVSLFQAQEKLKACRIKFKIKLFELRFHCRWQSCKNCMATCSSFHRT